MTCLLLRVSVLVSLHLTTPWPSAADIRVIHIATILSNSTRHAFSIRNVQPELEYTIEGLAEAVLPGHRLRVHYADSGCNSKDAPLAAFDLYMRREVNVYIGPYCDYSLAPVARYAPSWNVPVVTPGGLSADFGFSKTVPGAQFPMLTRVGATFDSMVRALFASFAEFQWKKVKVLYDPAAHGEVSLQFCYLASSSLIYHVKHAPTSRSKAQYDFHLVNAVPQVPSLCDVHVYYLCACSHFCVTSSGSRHTLYRMWCMLTHHPSPIHDVNVIDRNVLASTLDEPERFYFSLVITFST